ncbi:uncharacterized protein LOC129456965 [Periophthalmus magnuspinnatus]|uniref:uncharacterized protein LOC129456965 n=1 Tax=Periophthalmus magnuspinnatus TaxID=409849 RepID=UPI002436CF2A|nr:uncharacterized protein LOC129456965 [Periophthalmus magnuspinnatus]
MQSSSQPPKPRRFDTAKRTVPKSNPPAQPKEDKNMNTIPNPAARRVNKAPVASPRTKVGAQPRAPLHQPKAIAQKRASANFKAVKPKSKSTRMSAANQLSASPAPPAVPSLLPLDPNCNEPSLPCLCCDGRSPQDNNSMFNHNHNNNNTISLRQQMQLPAPPAPLFQKQEENRVNEEKPKLTPEEPQKDNAASLAASLENNNKSIEEQEISNNGACKVDEEDDDDDSSGDIDIDEEEEPDHYGDDEDDDDDTLVPSCCDCPPSLLDFSLTSSTSSSSTSISSCSDLDSDSADQSYSMSSSNDQENLSFMLSSKGCSPLKAPESKPPSRSPPSLPRSHNPFYLSSSSPASPDEGYPSALDSPDYLGIKEDSEMNKLSLLDFLESVGEFGKMERFSQVIQVARWDLEGEQHWDVLRDRIDHLDRLEKVNREVKLAYIAKLHEKGFDLSDLDEQDLSDIMDEMGNIDIPWKLYKNPKGKMQDSQEFSDAGVDLTAPSDCEDPLAPDSLTPSPIESPPKPPVRHASVTSDLHTYINISREPTPVASSPTPLTTFSLHITSPTFTTFRCEKSTPVTPPSIPPLPASKPVPYLTLYTAPSPTIPTPTPPIPPPRTRHLARKEAQRRAALLAEQEKSPDSLPPPTTRPPPLPPPPVISRSGNY